MAGSSPGELGSGTEDAVVRRPPRRSAHPPASRPGTNSAPQLRPRSGVVRDVAPMAGIYRFILFWAAVPSTAKHALDALPRRLVACGKKSRS